MFNRDRYKKYDNIKIDSAAVNTKAYKQFDEDYGSNYKVNNSYISIDDSGKLAMVYEVDVRQKSGTGFISDVDNIPIEID
jgi:hypothetical protein